MIVEVRDPRGHLLARHSLPGPRITIGRAYDNDVIVDDPYTDAHHAVASWDPAGAIRVEDLGSRNGTRLGRAPIPGTGAEARIGQRIVIGRRAVTIFAEDTPVAEALMMDSRLLASLTTSRWRPLALLAAASVYIVVSLLAVDYQGEGWGMALGVTVFLVVLACGWAGAWALGSKLLTQRAAFLPHLGWTCAFLLGLSLLELGGGYFFFALPSRGLEFVFAWLVSGWLAFTLLLLGHMELASRRSRRFKLMVANVASAVLVAVMWLFTTLDGGSATRVAGLLGPIRWWPSALVASSSVEEIVSGLDELRAALDEDALDLDVAIEPATYQEAVP